MFLLKLIRYLPQLNDAYKVDVLQDFCDPEDQLFYRFVREVHPPTLRYQNKDSFRQENAENKV